MLAQPGSGLLRHCACSEPCISSDESSSVHHQATRLLPDAMVTASAGRQAARAEAHPLSAVSCRLLVCSRHFASSPAQPQLRQPAGWLNKGC